MSRASIRSCHEKTTLKRPSSHCSQLRQHAARSMCRLRTPFLFCLRRLYLRAFRICNPTLSYTKNIIHKKIFVIECSMQSFPSIIRKINIGLRNGCTVRPAALSRARICPHALVLPRASSRSLSLPSPAVLPNLDPFVLFAGACIQRRDRCIPVNK